MSAPAHHRADIPSLTGIRFFAAFSILLNHLLLHIFPAAAYPDLSFALRGSGILGMNLFFILSGFIIHYNYSDSLSRRSGLSLYNFFSARVARLYPLFIVFVIFEIATEDYVLLQPPAGQRAILAALPWFATLSQSWHYALVGPSTSLAYVLQNSSITWSISTEFLMYAFYPLILWAALSERDTLPVRLCKLVVATAVLSLGMRWLINHPAAFDAFGIEHFGPAAGFAANPSHSFVNWILFLSPYMRILEFLIGAFCAHVFLARAQQPPGRFEKVLLCALTLLSLTMVAATYLPTAVRPAWALPAFSLFGYYPALAVLIYAAARWREGWLSMALSARPVVWCGEASYSIYLLHIVIYNRFPFRSETALGAVLRAVATIAFVILVARMLYVLVEMPMRGWVRRRLAGFVPLGPKAPAKVVA